MRPIILTIQAFGPFVGTEVVNFSKLGESPLFLINGPTGSGKSTILDAVCFALYGRTTGAEREASQMRCDLADVNLLTEVTLDFSLGDKEYRVIRSPLQERPKSKGEGITEHKGEANLWEIEASGELKLIIAKKLKAVTDEIETLTGLDVDQFRQVMVLPQGKFRELLLADSTDRERIFSKLFQTNIYKKIEDTLKNKSIEISSEVKAHQNKIKGILDGADVNTEEQVDVQLASELKALKDVVKNKDVMNKQLQAVLSEKELADAVILQFHELEKTKSSIACKEKLKPEFDDNKVKLEEALQSQKITPIFENLELIISENKQLEADIESCEKQERKLKLEVDESKIAVKQANENAKDIDKLKLKVGKFVGFETKLEMYEKSVFMVDDSKISYNKNNANFDIAKKGLEQQLLNKKNLDKFISVIQKESIELAPKQISLQKLEIQLEQRKALDLANSELIKYTNQENQDKQNFDKFSSTFDIVNQKANKQEMFWHAGQAASLAKELKDGVPCMVCGNTEHPNPSISVDEENIVTSEMVKDAREETDSARIKMQDAKDKINDTAGLIKQVKLNINKLDTQLGDAKSETYEHVKKHYSHLKSEIDESEQNQIKFQKVSGEISQCETDIEIQQKEIIKIQKITEESRIKFEGNLATLKQIENDFPEEYRNRSKLTTLKSETESKIKILEDTLISSQAKFDDINTSATKQEARKKELNSQNTKLNQKKVMLQTKWDNTISDSLFDTENHYKAALLTEIEQDILKTKIATYQEDLNNLKGELKQLEKSLKSKTKPDIELIEKECSAKKSSYKVAEGEWQKVESRVKQLQSVVKKLSLAHDKNEKLEKEYAIYGTLSSVANGQTGNKISLQRFVLSVLLDEVLIEASNRLSLMTKGRYLLLRKQDKSKGNKASGLELDVEDAYTGKSRSVATLSGGESFMAALALALGLSDVVQAYAGGIKLDMLFIDEGFGSLDQESLDLAIRTLIDLQATGRMIGIISHVTELKEQMALRLDVLSSKTGSTIRTVAA